MHVEEVHESLILQYQPIRKNKMEKQTLFESDVKTAILNRHKRVDNVCRFIMAIIVIMTFGSIASGQVSIARYKNNMKGALSLTFDDGLEEHFSLNFP